MLHQYHNTNSCSHSSTARQREGRISLFATTPSNQQQSYNNTSTTSSDFNNSLPPATSPYEKEPKRDYNAAMMSQLESQNEETVNIMHSKLTQLKDLSMKMGDEINKSKLNLGSLGSNMEAAGHRIRGNMKRMVIMAERSGISWKKWLAFFAIVFLFFLMAWLF